MCRHSEHGVKNRKRSGYMESSRDDKNAKIKKNTDPKKRSSLEEKTDKDKKEKSSFFSKIFGNKISSTDDNSLTLPATEKKSEPKNQVLIRSTRSYEKINPLATDNHKNTLGKNESTRHSFEDIHRAKKIADDAKKMQLKKITDPGTKKKTPNIVLSSIQQTRENLRPTRTTNSSSDTFLLEQNAELSSEMQSAQEQGDKPSTPPHLSESESLLNTGNISINNINIMSSTAILTFLTTSSNPNNTTLFEETSMEVQKEVDEIGLELDQQTLQDKIKNKDLIVAKEKTTQDQSTLDLNNFNLDDFAIGGASFQKDKKSGSLTEMTKKAIEEKKINNKEMELDSKRRKRKNNNRSTIMLSGPGKSLADFTSQENIYVPDDEIESVTRDPITYYIDQLTQFNLKYLFKKNFIDSSSADEVNDKSDDGSKTEKPVDTSQQEYEKIIQQILAEPVVITFHATLQSLKEDKNKSNKQEIANDTSHVASSETTKAARNSLEKNAELIKLIDVKLEINTVFGILFRYLVLHRQYLTLNEDAALRFSTTCSSMYNWGSRQKRVTEEALIEESIRKKIKMWGRSFTLYIDTIKQAHLVPVAISEEKIAIEFVRFYHEQEEDFLLSKKKLGFYSTKQVLKEFVNTEETFINFLRCYRDMFNLFIKAVIEEKNINENRYPLYSLLLTLNILIERIISYYDHYQMHIAHLRGLKHALYTPPKLFALYDDKEKYIHAIEYLVNALNNMMDNEEIVSAFFLLSTGNFLVKFHDETLYKEVSNNAIATKLRLLATQYGLSLTTTLSGCINMLIIAPAQRIPRYILLLKSLMNLAKFLNVKDDKKIIDQIGMLLTRLQVITQQLNEQTPELLRNNTVSEFMTSWSITEEIAKQIEWYIRQHTKQMTKQLREKVKIPGEITIKDPPIHKEFNKYLHNTLVVKGYEIQTDEGKKSIPYEKHTMLFFKSLLKQINTMRRSISEQTKPILTFNSQKK